MKGRSSHYIFPDPVSLGNGLACEFIKDVNRFLEHQEFVNIALSGGSTPVHFYRALVESNPGMDLKRIRFFWGDERCVGPEHMESNYGNAFKNLIEPLDINLQNVYRIRGEDDPGQEALRYSNVIQEEVLAIDGEPSFDWIFLGIGNDGHTLSIFPDQIDRWNDPQLCIDTVNPYSGQRRITFTGRLIHAARRITIMATGEDKSEVARKIIFKQGNYRDFPASLVKSDLGIVEWYLDAGSALLLT